ncbi:hypothetical protein BUALT_Bualt05G0084100 [Buddleja alternifolia]|uniref:Uncharacterized protein n=1 Tax=Buddleja alternifolia TaxID=168488 RepID=A0AAV6XQF7_9LAMI|nr:hypothetical protein BUALT_Bualt05G0084100 [Buddleja alternifolia]
MPVQASRVSPSPRLSASLSIHDDEKNAASSPRISLHMEVTRRRSSSESDLIINKLGSRSSQECHDEDGRPAIGISGGGMNKSRSCGGGGDAKQNKIIGAYYQEILKSDPTNSLILRNYGKYLHEVEGDLVKAEEYYGRAILANPGDGEVLSLYGKLIWESHRDESRANSYFNQALHASPDDCTVLGSYAHFLWEAEEEEEEDDEEEMDKSINDDVAAVSSSIAAMVEAF